MRGRKENGTQTKERRVSRGGFGLNASPTVKPLLRAALDYRVRNSPPRLDKKRGLCVLT